MRKLTRAFAATTLIGVGALGYATLVEPRLFRLRRFTLPVLREPGPDLRVLHLSDLHLNPRLKALPAWLAQIADTVPFDLVVVTGDTLGHRDAVGAALNAFAPFIDRPGIYVPGSNDYFGPSLKNPVRYLSPDDGARIHGEALPWRDLRAGLEAGRWLWLDNKQATVDVAGRVIDVRGLDDPHLQRDDLTSVAGPPAPGADLVLGVSHAPYLRVLDAFADAGADLVLAGHTHGGQLCVPGYGALVTNCDLATKNAKGVHEHSGPSGNSTLVHVSAGLGENLFTPIRFACPPEASLLTLTAS
jgi:predicted MPP superfamily phosphohydrolase